MRPSSRAPDVDPDRAALESERLPQSPLQEPAVPGLQKTVVNNTNVGGRAVAWVANRIRGCLPPRTGGGVAATTSLRNVFSRPVEIRVSHDSNAVSSAGTSFCTARPVLAEMLTRGAHCTCASSRSISRSRCSGGPRRPGPTC